MGRNKNKPTKNAAAVSPAAIPTGTTEAIVPAPTTTTTATFTQSPNPTFTQIGMAGMIGLLSTPNTEEPVAPAAAEEPKVEEPKVEETKVEETKVEETKVEETKVEEPMKSEESAKEAVAPLPEAGAGGMFGFFRRFYNSLGGAVHR